MAEAAVCASVTPVGIVATLTVLINGGSDNIVLYFNRKLTALEKNYTTVEKDCLSIIWGLRKFESYIGDKNILILGNRSSLNWLLNNDHMSNRLKSWKIYLNSFSFTIDELGM